jgi:alpha-N-arabinofuranosidase
MSRGYTSPHTTTPDHPPTLTPTQLVISPSNLANPSGEPVNKLIYAGFLEHLGRCIYGGIVDDPKDPADKGLLIEQEKGRLGVRKDVAEVLGAEGELAVPMLRWPGGESCYQNIVLSFADVKATLFPTTTGRMLLDPLRIDPSVSNSPGCPTSQTCGRP